MFLYRSSFSSDAFYEVPEDENDCVVLVYELGFVLIYLGCLPSNASGQADHIRLGPVSSQVLGDVTGSVGKVVNCKGWSNNSYLSSCRAHAPALPVGQR